MLFTLQNMKITLININILHIFASVLSKETGKSNLVRENSQDSGFHSSRSLSDITGGTDHCQPKFGEHSVFYNHHYQHNPNYIDLSVKLKESETKLELKNCNIREIPKFIFKEMRNLEELDLSHNIDLKIPKNF